MQISVQTTGALERSMRVEVPEEQIANKVEARLKSLSRTTRIKGFRPGKVPFKLIQQRFGGKARQEVIGEVLQSSFHDAISQENLRPAGTPQIGSLDAEQGQGLVYTAKFEVMPELELAAVEELEIEKPYCEISDADIDNMVEELRSQNRILEEVERPAKNDDIVDIDFNGTINGETFAGGDATNFKVELGSQQLLDGFEQGLHGKKSGDKVTLDLVFPDDYQNRELAGKPVRFQVTVNRIHEARLPELDDEFFMKFGIKAGGEAAFRKQIQEHMQREADQAVKNRFRDSVMNTLYEANKVELPNILVEQEKQRIQQQFEADLKARGIKVDEETRAIDESVFEEQAKRRVALQLIVVELVSANGLQVDAAKVRATIEQYAGSYEDPAAIINWYYADKNRLAGVEARVLENEVVEWIAERAKLTEMNMTFDECMNKRQTNSV